jgi:hypothetical protein
MLKVVNSELKSAESMLVEITQIDICLRFFHRFELVDFLPNMFDLLGIDAGLDMVIMHSCDELLMVNIDTLGKFRKVSSKSS